jgi:hypothetical protein
MKHSIYNSDPIAVEQTTVSAVSVSFYTKNT